VIRTAATLASLIAAAPFGAHAQNIGDVPARDIEPGEQSLEYRAA
jgi:hypothetical protein